MTLGDVGGEDDAVVPPLGGGLRLRLLEALPERFPFEKLAALALGGRLLPRLHVARHQVERLEPDAHQNVFHSSGELIGDVPLPVPGLRVLRKLPEVELVSELAFPAGLALRPQHDGQLVVRQTPAAGFEAGRFEDLAEFLRHEGGSGRQEEDQAAVDGT